MLRVKEGKNGEREVEGRKEKKNRRKDSLMEMTASYTERSVYMLGTVLSALTNISLIYSHNYYARITTIMFVILR